MSLERSNTDTLAFLFKNTRYTMPKETPSSYYIGILLSNVGKCKMDVHYVMTIPDFWGLMQAARSSCCIKVKNVDNHVQVPHLNRNRLLTFENAGQDDKGWTCLFRAVDQGHQDMIKMILQASDCTYAEKLLMLRDKVRNFNPMEDQGRIWIESSEESFSSKRFKTSWNEWLRAYLN
jgi:hypothetical protein